jgi:hypothetical protein
MLQRISLLAAAFLFCVFTSAQEASVVSAGSGSPLVKSDNAETRETPPLLNFSGSADVYYRYDFAQTKTNNYTSFTNSHNSFSLGMASLKAEHKGRKVSAVIDLGFGKRAADFSYTDAGIAASVKQLYVSYAPADWIKLTAGTWATHIGYELLDPQLNRNYSMSYMFTNGPFSHTGVKAEITKEKHGLMLGVSNATDFRTVPDGFINKKFVIAQYSYAPNDNVKLYLNYVSGQNPDTSKTSQYDLVLTAKISGKFNVACNGTYNNTRLWEGVKNSTGKNWWGSAVYLNYDPKSWLGLTLREEYFSDKDHLKLPMNPNGCSMLASTLSADFKIDNFIFISEFRIDHSSESMFVKSNGSGTKTASNVLFAAIYSF